MSADRVSLCPQCQNNAAERCAARWLKASQTYGKIPEQAYRHLLAEAEELVAVKESLLEYIDVGVTGRELTVNYGCRCKCGFSFDYNKTLVVYKP